MEGQNRKIAPVWLQLDLWHATPQFIDIVLNGRVVS